MTVIALVLFRLLEILVDFLFRELRIPLVRLRGEKTNLKEYHVYELDAERLWLSL